MNTKKVDHRLKVTIKKDNQQFDDILCEIYLPLRVTESIEFNFILTPQQSSVIDIPGEFELYGEIKDKSGTSILSIKATRVFKKDCSHKFLNKELYEIVLLAESYDLKIIEYFKHDYTQEEEKVNVVYKFSPSVMLSPSFQIFEYSGKGITIESHNDFNFTLNNGINLKFDNHCKSLNNDNEDIVSFLELDAKFEIPSKDLNILESFEPIDDFLLLTSFSERKNCICLGWESFGLNEYVKFFRRDISIPKFNKKHSYDDTLIDKKDYKDFIDCAYSNFNKFERKEFLKYAIYGLTDQHKLSIELGILNLYSSFENLITFHRINKNLEFIFNDNWETFRKDIEKFIKNHYLLSSESQKEKRKLIYKKLVELNRVSFDDAYKDFCKTYNIDLSDLWPINDCKKNGISLSEIRNNIIHGQPFNLLKTRALFSARENLKWILERSILSVLGWPFSNSNVSKNFLEKNRTMYKKWREDRKILSE